MPRSKNRASVPGLGKSAGPSALPTRFRCKVGGEWKSREAFSPNQQKLLDRQIASGGKLDPAHSGMTCREHASSAHTELRCELCGLVKHVEEFSRNTRKNGENQCKRCTAWVETQEPGVVPFPLETGHISVEEEGFDDGIDFARSSDFFSPGSLSQAASRAMGNLSLASEPSDRSTTASSSTDCSINTATSGRLPPHLKGLHSRAGSISGSESNFSLASESAYDDTASRANGKLPPHLRKKIRAPLSEASDDFTPSASKIQFNAWGPTGQQTTRFKSPTVASALSSTSSTSTPSHGSSVYSDSSDTATEEGDSGNNEDWEVSPPRERNKWPRVSETQPRLRKGNWPKVSDCRTPMAEIRKQANATVPVSRAAQASIACQREPNIYDRDDSD